MPISPTFTAMLVNYALFQVPFAINDWYFALLTGTSGDPIIGNEVSSSEYARIKVNWGSDFRNENEISWSAVNDAWGTVSVYGLCSAATGDNLLLYQTTTGTAMNPGTTLRFAPGAILLNIQ